MEVLRLETERFHTMLPVLHQIEWGIQNAKQNIILLYLLEKLI